MSKKQFTSPGLGKGLARIGSTLSLYRIVIFIVALTGLYGFIVWRINVLSDAPPSSADVSTAEQNVTVPKISQSAVQKLQSLQDNSVRVQVLFSEARKNPFNE